jgi:hypothetical protein
MVKRSGAAHWRASPPERRERRERFKWSSLVGRDRMLKIIAEKHPGLDASPMTEEWWKRYIVNCESKLLVVCLKCKQRCDTSSINNIRQGQCFGCLCNGGVPWVSLIGRDRMLRLIAEKHPGVDASPMTEEWWLCYIVDKNSKLLVICRLCNHLCDTSSIKHIQRGQGFGCQCGTWAGLFGRDRMLKLIAEKHPHIDASLMTEEWWLRYIVDKNSKLLVVCRVCEHRCDTSMINDIRKGGGFGCLCRHKTEAKLCLWLSRRFGEVQCQAGECYNAATGRRLPFDFAINMSSRVIFVELDGNIGHFGVGFRGEETRIVAERDLMKERWALEKDHSVVRVLQTSVWTDADDWDAYLLRALWSASLRPRIIHPAAPQYYRGIYAELRAV